MYLPLVDRMPKSASGGGVYLVSGGVLSPRVGGVLSPGCVCVCSGGVSPLGVVWSWGGDSAWAVYA